MEYSLSLKDSGDEKLRELNDTFAEILVSECNFRKKIIHVVRQTADAEYLSTEMLNDLFDAARNPSKSFALFLSGFISSVEQANQGIREKLRSSSNGGENAEQGNGAKGRVRVNREGAIAKTEGQIRGIVSDALKRMKERDSFAYFEHRGHILDCKGGACRHLASAFFDQGGKGISRSELVALVSGEIEKIQNNARHVDEQTLLGLIAAQSVLEPAL